MYNQTSVMKRLLFAALSMLALMACSGEDPVYWFEAGSSNGAAGSQIPYYPEKPSNQGNDIEKPADGYAPQGYSLVWSDEFDSQARLYSNWSFEKGGTGWGNQELQYYCDGGVYTPTGQQTAQVSDGTLKIKAYKIVPSASSSNCEFISARMNSKQGWEHGYIEMKARLPMTRGCWSAFWMLPLEGPFNVQDPSGWGGEIDIMEFVPGDTSKKIYFSAHSHNATPAAGKDTGYTDPVTNTLYSYCQAGNVPLANNWHCYGMEWTHEYIKGYVDGKQYFYAPNPDPDSVDQYAWPFDQKFYLKLNLAIGGSWGGTPAGNFTEDTYEIDWVRVYQK